MARNKLTRMFVKQENRQSTCRRIRPIDGDIKPHWVSTASVICLQSIDYLSTGHYPHNDMYMLEVGNKRYGTPVGHLPVTEQRSHFTAWALLKSPLLIETDLRGATNEYISYLRHQGISRYLY